MRAEGPSRVVDIDDLRGFERRRRGAERDGNDADIERREDFDTGPRRDDVAVLVVKVTT